MGTGNGNEKVVLGNGNCGLRKGNMGKVIGIRIERRDEEVELKEDVRM